MLHPRIKNVHSPFTLPGNRIIVGLGQYGVASELTDDDEGTLEHLLVLMDGTRDTDRICADLAVTHPDVDEASVREVIADLTAAGFVEDAAAELPAGLTDRDARRYASPRHYYAWIDTTPRSSPYDVQARLKRSRVALLGLGGTGSAVAAGLVASGVSLHCADFDVVEEGNLCRQLLYTESDVGAPKVERAVARLRGMNSLVAVTGEQLQVSTAEQVEALMTGCDAFVLCADSPHPEILKWTNEAAWRTRTPWFVALYTGPMAVVGSYLPGTTGCWECLWRKQKQQENFHSSRPLFADSRQNAVMAATAMVTGQLCALEVIHHLGGLKSQVPGRILNWNFANWEHQYFTDVPAYPDCAICGESTR